METSVQESRQLQRRKMPALGAFSGGTQGYYAIQNGPCFGFLVFFY
jgi:hypothetical protein